MRLTSEDELFVTWRSRAGHREDDRWVHDEPDGQRSGRLGKAHLVGDDGETACGHPIPDGGIYSGDPQLADVCHNCLRIIMKPFLP